MLALDRLGIRVKRGKRILQTKGSAPFLKEVVLFLASCFFSYETRYVYENTLEQVDGTNFTPKVQDLTLRIICTQEELDGLLADGYDFGFYPNIEEDKKWLNKDAILFCVFVGKELAHKSWVAMSEKAEKYVDRYPFKMDYQTEALIGGSATNPKYGRMGIYTYVYSEIYRYLKKSGKSKAWFTARKNNIAVHKSQAKLGSRTCGEGYHLKLLFLWELWRLKTNKSHR